MRCIGWSERGQSVPTRSEDPARRGPSVPRSVRRSALFHAVAIGATALFILPLYWMFAGSLRQPGLPPPRAVEWLPDPLTYGNFAAIFEFLPFDRYVFNSMLVTAIAVPITLVTASWAGFAMAQLPLPERRRLVLVSIGLLMVPITALWLTRYLLFTWVGIVDTYAALIAPALMGSSPLFVLLFYWTFRRVSSELFEASRIDGATPLHTWASVAMPLARPTIVAVAVLGFLLYWSDFISPLLYLKSQELYTLPVGLRQLQQLDRSNWPLLMAGCVLMTSPTVVMFAIAQRFFLKPERLLGTHVR